jgi:hypothetical protein
VEKGCKIEIPEGLGGLPLVNFVFKKEIFNFFIESFKFKNWFCGACPSFANKFQIIRRQRCAWGHRAMHNNENEDNYEAKSK